ncbi:hypothetical protein FB451DRAFT_1393914 [Mycena latifolia]|nr:hypothetical protein FB451DRAFT_1393914 [Mycena latifolia]
MHAHILSLSALCTAPARLQKQGVGADGVLRCDYAVYVFAAHPHDVAPPTEGYGRGVEGSAGARSESVRLFLNFLFYLCRVPLPLCLRYSLSFCFLPALPRSLSVHHSPSSASPGFSSPLSLPPLYVPPTSISARTASARPKRRVDRVSGMAPCAACNARHASQRPSSQRRTVSSPRSPVKDTARAGELDSALGGGRADAGKCSGARVRLDAGEDCRAQHPRLYVEAQAAHRALQGAGGGLEGTRASLSLAQLQWSRAPRLPFCVEWKAAAMSGNCRDSHVQCTLSKRAGFLEGLYGAAALAGASVMRARIESRSPGRACTSRPAPKSETTARTAFVEAEVHANLRLAAVRAPARTAAAFPRMTEGVDPGLAAAETMCTLVDAFQTRTTFFEALRLHFARLYKTAGDGGGGNAELAGAAEALSRL